MRRINHVMRDPHFFREINAYKVPETFATPESDQLPDREIAYRVVGLRSNENDIPYYGVVTAYNAAGKESPPSNEISFTVSPSALKQRK
jgi:hypothetical protein